MNKGQSYNSYWGKVSEVTEGDGEWSVYEVLTTLSRVFGTPFNTGSEMERGFIRQTDITRYPKRNRMARAKSKQKCDRCSQKLVIAEKKAELLTDQEK